MLRPVCLIWYSSRGSWFSDIMIPWKVQSWLMECLWKTGTWPICIDIWWLAQLYVHLMAEAQHQAARIWRFIWQKLCAIRHWWLKSLFCSILLCDKTFFMAFPIAILILIPRTKCMQCFRSYGQSRLVWTTPTNYYKQYAIFRYILWALLYCTVCIARGKLSSWIWVMLAGH